MEPPALPPIRSNSSPPPLPPAQPIVYGFHHQVACRFCQGPVNPGVQKCRHCGEFLSAPPHSNGLAGCLGLVLGPIGLWYKGQWAAGFAWIVVAVLVILGTGGLGIVFAPFFWIGMGVHAYVATPKR